MNQTPPSTINMLRKATIDDLKNPMVGENSDMLFLGVPDDILETIAAYGTVYRAEPNVILHQRIAGANHYEEIPLRYILNGTVNLERVSNDQSVVVGALYPGQLIGECEYILHSNPLISVVTAEVVTYIEFQSPGFILDIEHSQLKANLIIMLARKLRDRAAKPGFHKSGDSTAAASRNGHNKSPLNNQEDSRF